MNNLEHEISILKTKREHAKELFGEDCSLVVLFTKHISLLEKELVG